MTNPTEDHHLTASHAAHEAAFARNKANADKLAEVLTGPPETPRPTS